MPQALSEKSDNLAGGAHHNAPVMVGVLAHYRLTKRFDSRGKPREFSCRIVWISPHEMLLSVPITGVLGERIATNCEEFGKLEGIVDRLSDGAFVLKIIAGDEERANLAAKIDWYDKNKNHNVPDGRKHKRIVPKKPHSTLLLADGSCIRCFVIDMSVSGVAVSAEIDPAVGTPLAVGKVVGRVVRKLPAGFAVKFIELQNSNHLEQAVMSTFEVLPGGPMP
jgi:hypothetical protein